VRVTMGLAWIGMPDVDGVSIDLMMTPGPGGLRFGPLGLAHEWEMADLAGGFCYLGLRPRLGFFDFLLWPMVRLNR
jgi:hypothetical protein